MTLDRPSPLALTMGEPAGVGGEIALRAWRACRESGPRFFIIDDADRLDALSGTLGLAVPVRTIEAPGDADRVFADALPVLHRPLPMAATPGEPDPALAGHVIAAIETAVAFALSGAADAVVTNPIQKSVLYAAGFRFPGHTEFLAALAGDAVQPVMMLACAGLRTVPVTVHCSLRDAISQLSSDRIVGVGRITAAALAEDFGCGAPRLAVAGLNPHAGEAGALGGEDRAIVGAAVAALQAEGICAFGPEPPDTLFTEAARARYDAALCMYHDQALIPIKTLDFAGAVNVTLGLPFIRTSPDHGTALDIAGRGVADPASLIAALRLAADMAGRRRLSRQPAGG